ncbi:unnamed protein product [Lathyrus oleraceus]
MKLHRRRCVRPTSPEKESKHFMKAILPSPIHAKQIRIPDEFITRFGNELNDAATITVPDGRVWEMELKKRGNEVYFCNKWQEFAEYYCIGYGCYLSFKYEGNSKFSVVIFDATSVEISYSFKTNTKKRFKVEKSENGCKQVKIMSNSDSERSEDGANEFNPKKPYFRSKMNKGNSAYVSADFASKYLKSNVPMKLQNCHGEQWEVYAKSWGKMQISRGFSKFRRDNNISEGDICVFELIKENPVVLKVTVFPPLHYGD